MMQTGTVKWKSSGFQSLRDNQKVSFEVKQGPKGKQAANIQPL
jgi:CspA family cold shock protein